MAGFDLLVQVSKEAVLRLVQANVRLAGVALVPPFGIDIPLSFVSDGIAAIIVKGVSLRLFGVSGVELIMKFDNSSIVSEALTVTLLDGSVSIKAGLSLIDRDGRKLMAADLGNATTLVNFSPASETKIKSALAGGPIDFTLLSAAANSAVQAFLASAGTQTISNPAFIVEPGKRGSISTTRFERLVLQNVSNEAIGLFGMLLPERPLGDPSQLQRSGIPAGRDVSIQIGPEAFRQLIFCANLADSGQPLPPPCGSGTLDYNGVKITELKDTFGDGQIDIGCRFEKSGTCYDAKGVVNSAMTLSLSKTDGRTTVNAHVAVGEPSIDVDVPWYCTLGEVLMGPVGLLIADKIQSDAMKSSSSLGNVTSGWAGGGAVFGTGNIPGVSFDHIAIDPASITLAGKLPANIPEAQKPGVTITGSVTVEDTDRASQGTYVVAAGCMKGRYPYVEERRQQRGSFYALAPLLGKPLIINWQLEHWEGFWTSNSSPRLLAAVALDQSSGSVSLDGVKTAYCFPLPGGSTTAQTVTIHYETNQNLLTLRNNASEGHFALTLRATVTDPAGNTAQMTTSVAFEGQSVTMLGEYHIRVVRCYNGLTQRVTRVGPNNIGTIPQWVPVNYPRPDELAKLVGFLARQATEEGDSLLLHTKLAHGASFRRALAAPYAAQGFEIAQAPLVSITKATGLLT
jgi:hypothetical protein